MESSTGGFPSWPQAQKLLPLLLKEVMRLWVFRSSSATCLDTCKVSCPCWPPLGVSDCPCLCSCGDQVGLGSSQHKAKALQSREGEPTTSHLLEIHSKSQVQISCSPVTPGPPAKRHNPNFAIISPCLNIVLTNFLTKFLFVIFPVACSY